MSVSDGTEVIFTHHTELPSLADSVADLKAYILGSQTRPGYKVSLIDPTLSYHHVIYHYMSLSCSVICLFLPQLECKLSREGTIFS